MTNEEKKAQDQDVQEAWELFSAVQSELEFVNDAQERLLNLLKDFGVHEWGRQNWSEDHERVLGDLRESLEALGKLVK